MSITLLTEAFLLRGDNTPGLQEDLKTSSEGSRPHLVEGIGHGNWSVVGDECGVSSLGDQGGMAARPGVRGVFGLPEAVNEGMKEEMC